MKTGSIASNLYLQKNLVVMNRATPCQVSTGAARRHRRTRLVRVCRYFEPVVVYDPSRATVCRETSRLYSARQSAVNSRVRDLVDVVLLIQSDTMVEDKVAEAVSINFERRK